MTENDDAVALSKRVREINLGRAMAEAARSSPVGVDISAFAAESVRSAGSPQDYGEAALPDAGSDGAVIDILQPTE
jgi:hypothetical protein